MARQSASSAPEPDEYDVIVLYNTASAPLRLRESKNGQVVFEGYHSTEQCSTVRNKGDILVEIDGVPLKSFDDAIRSIKSKASLQTHSFMRFRNCSLSELPREPQRREIQKELSSLNQDLEAKKKEVEAVENEIEQKKDALHELQEQDLEWLEEKRTALQREIDETIDSQDPQVEQQQQKQEEEAARMEKEIQQQHAKAKALRDEVEQHKSQLQRMKQQERSWLQQMKIDLVSAFESAQQEDKQWLEQIKEDVGNLVQESKNQISASREKDRTEETVCGNCERCTALPQSKDGSTELETLVTNMASNRHSHSRNNASNNNTSTGTKEPRPLSSFDLICNDFTGCVAEVERAIALALNMTHIDVAEEQENTERLKQFFSKMHNFLTYNDEYMVDLLAEVGIGQLNYKTVISDIEKHIEWLKMVEDRRGTPSLLHFCQCLKRVFDGHDRSNEETRYAKRKREDNDDDAVQVMEPPRAAAGASSSHGRRICPITHLEMTEAVRNSQCFHVYSRRGIEQLIALKRGRCKCPVAGCANSLVTMSQMEPFDLTADVSGAAQQASGSSTVNLDETPIKQRKRPRPQASQPSDQPPEQGRISAESIDLVESSSEDAGGEEEEEEKEEANETKPQGSALFQHSSSEDLFADSDSDGNTHD